MRLYAESSAVLAWLLGDAAADPIRTLLQQAELVVTSDLTLVECDRQNLKGANHVDLWRLKLDGSSRYERLTHFSDYPGYKASNPVVSDDGRFIAFQMARSGEAAGVGHGIFIYDLAAESSTTTGTAFNPFTKTLVPPAALRTLTVRFEPGARSK